MKAQRLAAASIALAVLSGCHDTPSDLRVWRPSDHDQPELSQNNNQAAPSDGGAAAPRMPPGINQVVLVAWRQNCTSCHGMFGKGDGPEGPMVGARDLTDPKWQSSVSDAEIAQVIQKGRGRMPHFDFPSSTLQGLVRLVRLMSSAPKLNAVRPEAGAAPKAAPSATTASAPHPKPSKRVAASGGG